MGFFDLFKKESAEDLRNKGVALYEEKKYKQAAECFSKAMGMGDIGAEMMLGTMLRKRKTYWRLVVGSSV